MYVDLAPTHCSKCNSTNSENFSNANFDGIRCKGCGHEKILNMRHRQKDELLEPSAYTATERREF